MSMTVNNHRIKLRISKLPFVSLKINVTAVRLNSKERDDAE